MRDSPVYQAPRPGTVLAAAILTVVTAAFTILGTLLATGLVLWLADPIFDSFSNHGNLRWYVVGFAAAAVSGALASSWLAWQVARGRNWARLALAGLALLTIALSLVLITLVLPVFTMIAGVVVLALLFSGSANEWFRSERTRPRGDAVGQDVQHV